MRLGCSAWDREWGRTGRDSDWGKRFWRSGQRRNKGNVPMRYQSTGRFSPCFFVNSSAFLKNFYGLLNIPPPGRPSAGVLAGGRWRGRWETGLLVKEGGNIFNADIMGVRRIKRLVPYLGQFWLQVSSSQHLWRADTPDPSHQCSGGRSWF